MKHAVAVLALLVLLPSCDGNVFGPEEIAGSYALRSTPVLLHPGSVQLEIVFDTLRLHPNGTALRTVRQIVHADETLTLDSTEPYMYRIRHGRIELAFVCSPSALALCSVTPPPHIWGVATRDGLVLRHGVDSRVRMEYSKVPTNVRLD